MSVIDVSSREVVIDIGNQLVYHYCNMTQTKFIQQVKVRASVYDYLEAFGLEDVSLRMIAEHVKQETGFEVPASTIKRLVNDYGFTFDGEGWEGELKERGF